MNGPAPGGRPAKRITVLLVLGSLFATANAVLANAVGDTGGIQGVFVFTAAVICGAVALGVGTQIPTQPSPPLDRPRPTSPAIGPGEDPIRSTPSPHLDQHGQTSFFGSQRAMRVTGYVFAGGAAWTVAFWPFLLVGKPLGLLAFVGLVIAAAAGELFLRARLRLPRLTITTDGMLVQRSPLSRPVRVRWDEIASLDFTPDHRLAVDFKNPDDSKGLPILVGHGGHTLCDLRSLAAEESDVMDAVNRLRRY